jgi:hypothetical protein
VATPLSGAVRDSILEWHRTDPYTVGEDFDRYFYYLTLMARVSEPMTLYLMVDNLQDDSNPFYYGQEGYLGFHAGVSYGVTEALILKVQGTFDRAVYDTGEPVHPVRKFTDTWLSAGFSISF